MRLFLRARPLAVALALTVCGASVSGCAFFAPSESKVRAGELYETAHPKYDPYFRDVHGAQVEAGAWEDQKRAVRRPLVDALKIDPDAADVTVIQATHERVLGVAREAGNVRLDVADGQGKIVVQNPAKLDEAARTFFQVVESTVRAESERARALRDVPAKVDAIAKQGHALEPQVRDDLARRGGRAAKQVLEELQASYDVLSDLSKGARLSVREAEDFIADLRRAVGADMAEAAARPGKGAKGAAKPKGAAPAADAPAPPKPKPVATPTPPPADTPKPKPAESSAPAKPPPPKPADEFNP
ncbi:MAG: hypothetical protein U0235_32535 [Polyangiaceae bacterium]